MKNVVDQVVECKSVFVVTYKKIDNHEINKETYDKDFETICKIASLNNLVYFLERLKDFETAGSFYINVFEEGIQPCWEDENNKNGCSWSLLLKKEICHRFFERLLIRICTGYFKTFEPSGIVGVSKDDRFKLSIWSKSLPLPCKHAEVVSEIKASLNIDYNLPFQFKNHSRILDR